MFEKNFNNKFEVLINSSKILEISSFPIFQYKID